MSIGSSAVFPSGPCLARTAWRVDGGVWKPVAPTVRGACMAALHFLADRGRFIIRPSDFALNTEFSRLIALFPGAEIVEGLTIADDVPALRARYPRAIESVTGVPYLWTLPLVPLGSAAAIDITRGMLFTPTASRE